MANPPNQFGAIVDYGEKETICIGPFYIQPGQPGQYSILTFTTVRPKPTLLFN